jgi:hypothetical protein
MKPPSPAALEAVIAGGGKPSLPPKAAILRSYLLLAQIK